MANFLSKIGFYLGIWWNEMDVFMSDIKNRSLNIFF